MEIPECYEPWRQADAREAKWDSYLSRFPVCERCGAPIMDSKLIYIEKHDEFYHLSCIEAMEEFNDAAEVE